MRLLILCLMMMGTAVLAACGGPERVGAAEPERTPAPRQTNVEEKEETQMAEAMFGAGCFWGVEAAFRKIGNGVKATAAGYSGGQVEDPTYREVCSGTTGHAEVVHVTYDPNEISYEELLKVFWENHDPTQLNRQGPDRGEQYRSVIFTYDADQEKAARASKEALQKTDKYKDRDIVTAIEPAREFYRAEDYHQQYLEKRGLAQCHF